MLELMRETMEPQVIQKEQKAEQCVAVMMQPQPFPFSSWLDSTGGLVGSFGLNLYTLHKMHKRGTYVYFKED
jgi:hypothetical protein